MMCNVRNWKKCIVQLKYGYSLVSSGTKWVTNLGGESFLAGTIFLANSNFISQLNDPAIVPERFRDSRGYSELWPTDHNLVFNVFEVKKTFLEKVVYKLKFNYARLENNIISILKIS